MSKKENLTFGEAQEALLLGQMVQRAGWNGKGIVVFKQIPATIPANVVPTMQSLPQAVKDELAMRDNKGISYENQLAMLLPSNVAMGWSPSIQDAFAKDWRIVEPGSVLEQEPLPQIIG